MGIAGALWHPCKGHPPSLAFVPQYRLFEFPYGAEGYSSIYCERGHMNTSGHHEATHAPLPVGSLNSEGAGGISPLSNRGVVLPTRVSMAALTQRPASFGIEPLPSLPCAEAPSLPPVNLYPFDRAGITVNDARYLKAAS